MKSSSCLWVLALFALLFVACDDKDTTATDTSTGDATTDGDTTPPPDPKAFISAPLNLVYTYINPDDNGVENRLYITANEVTNSELRQSELTPLTSNINCASSTCIPTPDLSHLLVQNGSELRVGPIGAGPSITDTDLQLLASNADSFKMAGKRLAYATGNDIYYYEIGGAGVPEKVGELVVLEDGDDYRGGGIALPDSGNFLLIYRYDLSSLAVFRLDVSTQSETFLFRLGIPRGAGSLFSGNNPITLVDEGNTAVMLLEGLHLYEGACTSSTDCSSRPESQCYFFSNTAGVQSSTGLCGNLQRSLQRFALEDSDIGQECAGTCDARHRCITNPETLIKAEPEKHCMPTQRILGPKSPSACDLRETGQFAEIYGKLRTNENDEILYLGVSDCGQLDISDNAVIAVAGDLSSSRIVDGDFNRNYDQTECFDTTSQSYDFTDCPQAIEIDDFELGPDGAGLVLLGSGPNDITGSEIWLYDEDGNRYPLTNDIFFDVESFFATQR